VVEGFFGAELILPVLKDAFAVRRRVVVVVIVAVAVVVLVAVGIFVAILVAVFVIVSILVVVNVLIVIVILVGVVFVWNRLHIVLPGLGIIVVGRALGAALALGVLVLGLNAAAREGHEQGG
jgi:hypothetical protein